MFTLHADPAVQIQTADEYLEGQKCGVVEERARQQIDLLQQFGWIVQDRSQTNLAAGPGVAIREALLKGGEADSSQSILNQLYDFGS